MNQKRKKVHFKRYWLFFTRGEGEMVEKLKQRKTKMNVQELFLKELTDQKIPVTFFLTSGFQIHGTLMNYDNFTVTVHSNGRQQLIYKHAISTFVPSKTVSLD